MICQIKNFFCPLGILWYKFLSYIEVLHVLSELSKLLELSELIELPEVFSSMKKCLFCGALRLGDPLIKLLELRFVSSSSETSRSSGTIQTSQSSISSHPVFPDVVELENVLGKSVEGWTYFCLSAQNSSDLLMQLMNQNYTVDQLALFIASNCHNYVAWDVLSLPE